MTPGVLLISLSIGMSRFFHRAKVVCLTIAVATSISASPTTRANTIALDFTGGTLTSNANHTFGWAFTLSGPVLVTDLGVWDHSGDGLVQFHPVTIWTDTGTVVTSAVVPGGTGATLVDDFRYVSIAPTLLAAGSYVIGAYYPVGPTADTVIYDATITTAPGVTYDGTRRTVGNTFPAGNFLGFDNGYFGPNFQFIAANGVPETGGTIALLLAGVAPLIAFRSKSASS